MIVKKPKKLKVKGADYTWSCGCYMFCGNLIACSKHSPYPFKK